MNALKEKLLTIITESDIEDHLLEDLDKLGAKGYTISCVKGKGEKGIQKFNEGKDNVCNPILDGACRISVRQNRGGAY